MNPALTVFAVIDGLGTGGAEHSMVAMAGPLRERGVDLTAVVLYRRPEGLDPRVSGSDLPVVHIEARSLPGRMRVLRRLIREKRPHLVHTTLFQADLVGRFASLRTGVPVLTSLVNTSYTSVRRMDPSIRLWRLTAVQKVEGWTARRFTTHFHALSEAVRDSAIRHLGIDSERVSVIGRGRSPQLFAPPAAEQKKEARDSLGLTSEGPVLVTLGRQEFQKGHTYLIDAIGHLRARFPELRLFVAGRRGAMSETLIRRVEKLELTSNVRFLGHVDDVRPLLAVADVFVFPSMYEGLGGAVIEAMAMEVPVIASDIPALREVLGTTGRLVPPGDPSAIAVTVEEMLSSPAQTRELASAARARFLERFTLDKIADQMAGLYHRVAVLDPAARSRR